MMVVDRAVGRVMRALAVGLVVAAAAGGAARAQDADAGRLQRWTELRQAIFGARAVGDGSAMMALEAPVRAEDAALVPISVTARGAAPMAGLYVVIDDNPSPMAAHFSFGPAADARAIHLRVRVDQYTDLHAVAEDTAGRLYAVGRFVKAAGGCSAPAGSSDAAALEGMGQMRLHVLGPVAPGQPVAVELLIRHPNFNGMQMNQVTRLYTPARFVNAVEVTIGGARVFHLDSDISLSTNPAITFNLRPGASGTLLVVARDSTGAVFRQSFEVPGAGAAVGAGRSTGS